MRRSGGAPVATTNDEHGRATPETPRVQVRALTVEEKGAWVDEINARMAGLERQWEKSKRTDLHALHGALIFCGAQLPPWLFSGLCRLLEQQFPQLESPYHEIRWMRVREERDAGRRGVRVGFREACRHARTRRPRHNDEELPENRAQLAGKRTPAANPP